ncbi:MAG: Rrf2 family transcriptional regulator [Chloroflexi bacterium]|nr:Rrf2 family transcriptional regulator [Chloroflexota bacterium]
MHIPIKVDYGVRALVYLAMNSKDAPIRTSEIASRSAVPEPYLAQVLHTLNKSGLIQSQRGRQGGHSLAKHPSEIRLSKVMYCLGGTEMPVACLDDVQSCIHVPGCAQRDVWKKVALAVFNILDSTTIEDLVNKTPAGQQGMRAPLERVRLKTAV